MRRMIPSKKNVVALALAMPTLTAVIAWAAIPQAVDGTPRPCGTQADILVRSDPTLAPVRPADCAVVTQTPPELTWPPQDGRHTYVVSLTHPGGRTEKRTTQENWIVWDRALPPGEYQWQVRVKDGESGAPRRFTIAANAASFIVPGDEAALARARQLAHPRSWPKDDSSPIAALKAERARAFAALLDEVEGKMASEVQAEPKAESMNANYDDAVAEQKRTLTAALASAATRQPR